MSALPPIARKSGHPQKAMSAPPPKADMCSALTHVCFGSKADICGAKSHVRFTPNSDRESGLPEKSCLLYPRKQTCAAHGLMSAMGQERTSRLLDHLIGCGE